MLTVSGGDWGMDELAVWLKLCKSEGGGDRLGKISRDNIPCLSKGAWLLLVGFPLILLDQWLFT